MHELELEGAGGKFTYAEVEQNEAAMARLRRWLNRIRWRDVFGASRPDLAESTVRAAHERLEEFTTTAVEREARPLLGASTGDSMPAQERSAAARRGGRRLQLVQPPPE